MTKMIEHTLNLPSMEELLGGEEAPNTEAVEAAEAEEDEAVQQALALAEQAESSVAIMNGDGHDKSMDEIHQETLEHARNIMDLGFNVDQRSAATIFEKANMLYKTALDAKNAKRDAQLKAIKLMQDQQKLELDRRRLELEEQKIRAAQQRAEGTGGGNGVVQAESFILEDRNEIIAKMRAKAQAEKEAKQKKD